MATSWKVYISTTSAVTAILLGLSLVYLQWDRESLQLGDLAEDKAREVHGPLAALAQTPQQRVSSREHDKKSAV
jgi:hypothetical protein